MMKQCFFSKVGDGGRAVDLHLIFADQDSTVFLNVDLDPDA